MHWAAPSSSYWKEPLPVALLPSYLLHNSVLLLVERTSYPYQVSPSINPIIVYPDILIARQVGGARSLIRLSYQLQTPAEVTAVCRTDHSRNSGDRRRRDRPLQRALQRHRLPGRRLPELALLFTRTSREALLQFTHWYLRYRSMTKLILGLSWFSGCHDAQSQYSPELRFPREERTGREEGRMT